MISCLHVQEWCKLSVIVFNIDSFVWIVWLKRIKKFRGYLPPLCNLNYYIFLYTDLKIKKQDIVNSNIKK